MEKQINNSNGAETRAAVISIIVENPDSAAQINEILHSAADSIIGRMGLPIKRKISALSALLSTRSLT